MAIITVLEDVSDYKAIQPDQDGLWKKLIGELFEEFMLFFAPDLYEEIDFTIEPNFLQQELFKEVIIEKKGRVNADQIVKVFMKSGKERWILVHVEVQGIAEKEFSERMFKYFYKIYDKFNREIYAIALITDAEQSSKSNRFSYSELEYAYNMYEFHGKDIEQLEQSSNPFAAAVLAGIYASKTKNESHKRYLFKRKLMIEILQKFSSQREDTRTYLTSLFYFIDYLLRVPAELKKKLSEDIRPLIGKETSHTMRAEKEKLPPTIAELFADAKDEGREETKKMLAQELMREGFSDEHIAKLTKLGIEEVVKLRKSLQ
ncbi:hypothetical protein ACFOUV_15030 [Oceanobacillus longus]|uniref:Transposase (putative) YhgA-like domain-containing protein n=2 Tax=Oceanobacillus longus TaxID=930120 RepID=A0ABV8H2M2_9BACI